MKFPQNNLKSLSSSGSITQDQYNFYIEYYKDFVYVRRKQSNEIPIYLSDDDLPTAENALQLALEREQERQNLEKRKRDSESESLHTESSLSTQSSYTTDDGFMSKDRHIVGSVLDIAVKKYNGLLNDKISFENYMKTFNFREYALCVLFNSSKNIFISLRHEIPGADYNGKYQVTGGKVDPIDRKQKDYFLTCARRKVLEKSGIILGDDNLIHVVTEENSRIFPKRETEDVYRTAVYIADIEDVVPQCMEPEKNSE
ncbi:9201_t:CDS:2 [Scutellospora calospora]|uniref:9201_t:CDS:1 n=1 Tax=Scutellospora calospora TaxID=85575 RepID=A0ACA9MQP6_9GLOM|nr:9201_t:CDS:2 [Scutellospora calospora]